jgi:hypothetical protein
VNLVAEIVEMIGRYSVLAERNLTPRLRRDNRLRTIQASLAIEQNSLTRELVTAIVDGKIESYVPKQGDFVSLTFDPQSGHEQEGCRPALVVSKDAFNRGTALAIVCPVTNSDRGIPFHACMY